MKIILAADEKWGIGKGGDLLCHIPGDLKYFKEKTTGNTIVMGRVTLESLPGSKGLPNRRNIVLTRNMDYTAERAEVVHTDEELFKLLEDTPGEVLVTGGAEIYAHFLPYCDECLITKIYADFGADRFFENLDEREDFTCEALSDVIEENGISYQFFKYTRCK